jgi:hypothetical protein
MDFHGGDAGRYVVNGIVDKTADNLQQCKPSWPIQHGYEVCRFSNHSESSLKPLRLVIYEGTQQRPHEARDLFVRKGKIMEERALPCGRKT